MSTRRVESFLLRIVVPSDLELSPEQWRGRIQHVASGTEQQIDELAQVVAFIAAHLSSCVETPLQDEPVSTPLLDA